MEGHCFIKQVTEMLTSLGIKQGKRTWMFIKNFAWEDQQCYMIYVAQQGVNSALWKIIEPEVQS